MSTRKTGSWRFRRFALGASSILLLGVFWLSWSLLSSPSPRRASKPSNARETAKARREIEAAFDAGRREEWRAAIDRLQSAAGREADDQLTAWAHYQRGIALKASGDPEGAIVAFRQLQRRFPNSNLSLRAEELIRECRANRARALGEETPGEGPVPAANLARPLGLCGPECLKLICDHYQLATSVGELARLSHTKVEGATFAGLKRAAEAKGLRAKGVIGNLLYLAKAPMPCIVWVNGNHFLLVTRATTKAVWLVDPADKAPRPRKLPAPDFLRAWAGHTLELTPSPARVAAPLVSEGKAGARP